MFNQHDVKRDSCMLHGPLAHHGYDRKDGQFILTDEIEASHIGCEYGEYDHSEAY